MTSDPPSYPGYTVVTVPLNASSLKLMHCAQKYHNVVSRGLRHPVTHEALMFGTALHKFIQLVMTGTPSTAAMQEICKTYKGTSGSLLLQTCLAMPKDFATPYRDNAGVPYVERKFWFYWRTWVNHGTHTQYDVYLCGTMDFLSRRSDGMVEIVDWKSSRKWKTNEVFEYYRVSTQMRFYLWVAYKFGHNIFDFDVASACMQGQMFLRIGAIFLSHTPPLWKFGSPLQIWPGELDKFGEELEHFAEHRLIPALAAPSREGMLNDTCYRTENGASSCEFAGMCHADNETAYAQCESQFKVVPYDPRNF